jgi:GDP-4-dehydro-6-deoxy-D-mannose reductase
MLIIGASGFVGTHLQAAAAARGLRVVPAGRRATGAAPACDLLDPASAEACLAAIKPDFVVCLSGAPSIVDSWRRPGESFAVNATASLNLLEAVSTHAPEAHLVCLSSAAVYGEPAAAAMPLGEGAPIAPVSPYGAAKATMEMLCGQYSRSRGLSVAVVRAFNLIGPSQPRSQAASALVRRVAVAESAGAESVELALGNPSAARDFTDVRDAAAALVEIAARRHEGTYNLCSGRVLSVAELVAELALGTSLDVTIRIDPALARPADPPLLVGDPSRLREAIGFAAKTPIAASLSDLLEWWRVELAAA